MKLATETVKNKRGKTKSVEEYFYDDKDNRIRTDYKDGNGKLKYYRTFTYDGNGKCLKQTDFSADNTFQGSDEHTYDNNGNEIKTIVRTVDGSIYEWYENFELPAENLKAWIAKDKYGNIIHKTEENLIDHSLKRFNEDGIFYELCKRKYDSLNRLVEEITTDENGKEKMRNLYSYEGQKEIWTFILQGEFIKTEEKVYDNNHNLTYYIRKDKNGKCLEWSGYTYNEFGNKTKYFGGKDEGVENYFGIIEPTYLQEVK